MVEPTLKNWAILLGLPWLEDHDYVGEQAPELPDGSGAEADSRDDQTPGDTGEAQ